MKHFCCRCHVYMDYENHEPLDEGSLGIFFRCPGCGHRIALITNPGETMLVHSLGVKLGGGPVEGEPLELTRITLRGSEGREGPLWSAEAKQRLERVPPFARAMARQTIERYALEHGYREITEAVIEEYKGQMGALG
ncbi:MAG: PCP reductase family protein [candidate division NC10 bacterium]|nr:PCP reductase family protein [candidate division NC10 bacterium]